MLNSRRKGTRNAKNSQGGSHRLLMRFYKSTDLHTVLFIFLHEGFVVRGHHRVLFSGRVQVLFDAVHRIHGVLEGADQQVDFARVGDCVTRRKDARVADAAVWAAFDEMIVIELEAHRISERDCLFAGETVVDDDRIGSDSPMLTADREGNGFDFALAVGTERADLRFQKQRAAVVAESLNAVFMRAQFIAAASQCHVICDGQQFVCLLDRCVSASRKENFLVAERIQAVRDVMQIRPFELLRTVHRQLVRRDDAAAVCKDHSFRVMMVAVAGADIKNAGDFGDLADFRIQTDGRVERQPLRDAIGKELFAGDRRQTAHIPQDFVRVQVDFAAEDGLGFDQLRLEIAQTAVESTVQTRRPATDYRYVKYFVQKTTSFSVD